MSFLSLIQVDGARKKKPARRARCTIGGRKCVMTCARARGNYRKKKSVESLPNDDEFHGEASSGLVAMATSIAGNWSSMVEERGRDVRGTGEELAGSCLVRSSWLEVDRDSGATSSSSGGHGEAVVAALQLGLGREMLCFAREGEESEGEREVECAGGLRQKEEGGWSRTVGWSGRRAR